MPKHEEIIKALRFAVELEKMGLKTYLDLAKKTADDTPEAKQPTQKQPTQKQPEAKQPTQKQPAQKQPEQKN